MAAKSYFVNGERVPSVTSVLAKFKDPGPLMWWAAEEAKAGRDFRQTRDNAADAGTLAHKMVESHIRRQPMPTQNGHSEEVWSKADLAYGAYLEWESQSHLEAVDTELSLTCECHRLGGTLDGTYRINGKLSLGDVKTSKGIYSEYLCQISAYSHLYAVNFPDKPLEGGFHIMRFTKEGNFSHHWWPQLDLAWEQFKLFRRAYDIDRQLKDML